MSLNFYIRILCPTPNRYNKKQCKIDIDTFIRKVKLKVDFKNKEQDIESWEFRILRNKAQIPKENHNTVETFTQAFQNDLRKEEENIGQIPHKNLLEKEEDTLQNFYKRDYIIITKADKGGTIIIVDVDDYVQEANQQLDKKEIYK